MLEKEDIEKKLLRLPTEFEEAMKSRQYARAIYIYNTARNVAVFVEAREIMEELFGVRADKGKILKEGRFRESDIMKAMYEEKVKK